MVGKSGSLTLASILRRVSDVLVNARWMALKAEARESGVIIVDQCHCHKFEDSLSSVSDRVGMKINGAPCVDCVVGESQTILVGCHCAVDLPAVIRFHRIGKTNAQEDR